MFILLRFHCEGGGQGWDFGEIAALHGYGLGPDGAPIVRDRRAVCC